MTWVPSIVVASWWNVCQKKAPGERPGALGEFLPRLAGNASGYPIHMYRADRNRLENGYDNEAKAAGHGRNPVYFDWAHGKNTPHKSMNTSICALAGKSSERKRYRGNICCRFKERETMISQEMLSAYERIIQKRFDHVCVMIDSRFRDEYGESIRVLGVPDDRRAEFAAFVLDELASGVEDAGFDFVGVVPCSWADAKEVFPGIGTREAEEILTRV